MLGRRVSALLLLWAWMAVLTAAFGADDPLPRKPTGYCADAAGVLKPSTVRRLDETLRRFEEQTSNQILVAIYPQLPAGAALQDYTFRIAQSWGVGQKGRNNGAVLFVFTGARRAFIQVGYGLEGALPDVLCKRIIEGEIVPAFRAGDYDTGVLRGVDAMLKATRGEYVGRGPRKARGKSGEGFSWPAAVFLIVIFLIVALARPRRRNGFFIGPGPGSFGGFSGGGGGSSGGGFSSGGGSFGGGGAGGDW